MSIQDDPFEYAARQIELEFAGEGNEIIAGLLEESRELIIGARLYLPWHPIRAARLHKQARQIHGRVRLIQGRVDDALARRRSAPGYLNLEDL